MINAELGQQLIQQTIQSLARCVKMMDELKMNDSDCMKKSLVPHLRNCVDTPANNLSCLGLDQSNVNQPTMNGSVSGHMISSASEDIVIEAFRDETQMSEIMEMITKDLSEPYSIYTYRYFIHKWPHLCLLARNVTKDTTVGVIICKMEQEPLPNGYIAMLAVDAAWRRRGIGSRLVRAAIDEMNKLGCVEIFLETEVTNEKALNLYGGLGFIRECRLFRYYLNGVDAFRLKLQLRFAS